MKPFEETTLSQHPEVKAAYAFLKKYVDQGMVDFDDQVLKIAETVSALYPNDPALIAAAVALPVQMAAVYNEDAALNRRIEAALPVQAVDYMIAYAYGTHPAGVEKFPRIPLEARQGAFTLIAAGILTDMKEMEQFAKTAAPEQLQEIRARYSAFSLEDSEDPIMPGLQDYADMAGLTVQNAPVLAEIVKLAEKLGGKETPPAAKPRNKRGGNGPRP